MKKQILLFLFIVTTFNIYGNDYNFIVNHQFSPGDGIIYISTQQMGFWVSKNDGISWVPLNTGLPKKVVYPFENEKYRLITSFYVAPDDPERIVLSTSSAVYLTDNGGNLWEKIPLGGNVKRTNYITSVTLSSVNPDLLIIGTSFNGIFRTLNRGKSWEKIRYQNDPLYMGAHFYEEITSLAFDDSADTLYIACGLSNSLYMSFEDKTPTEIKIPELKDEVLKYIYFSHQTAPSLNIYTDKNTYSRTNNVWVKKRLDLLLPDNDYSDDSLKRKNLADNKKGLYINSFHASGNDLQQMISTIKSNGLNSMVVDMKDDEGRITYNTSLQLPISVGSIKERFKIEELVKIAHKNDIYLIGRIVTFKDPILYKFKNGLYAIWDSELNRPWGNKVLRDNKYVQTEFWTDPFSPDVWDYNISIAEELQAKGVDEIQFDYIRFPSDGDLSRAKYRYQKSGMNRTDALESFLAKLREKIRIPISTDLYGFNSWYRMGNWIGQDIELFSNYVDIISPMFYPSHFPRNFKYNSNYIEWANMIYHIGTIRAKQLTGNRIIIRPYVQAFLIGKELAMEKEEYTAYLKSELNGLYEGRSSGYTLWNNSNNYYMLE